MSQVPKPRYSPQLSAVLAGPAPDSRGTPLPASDWRATAFDTMETKFFREGDELSELATGPGSGDGWDESTVTVKRRWRRGGLASWAAVGTAAVLLSCVLAFRLASREPIPLQAVAAETMRPLTQARTASSATTATGPLGPEPTISVPAAAASDSPELPLPSLPSPPQAAAGAPSPQAQGQALAACRSAFARHRGKDVLAECGRAFAEDPNAAEVAVMLAKTELDRGRFRPALEWARKALAIDDQQADAYVFVGGAEQAFGHRAAAKSAYQRYLELAPKGRYAADLRAVLRSL